MRSSIFSAYLIILLALLPGGAVAGELFIMAEQYPPYCYEKDGKTLGFVVEIVSLIQQKLGEQPGEIHFYPWARGYKKLQTGSGDILFPMGMTPERSAQFKFVGPVYWDDVYFYRKKGSDIDICSIAEARKIGKIGVTRDDLYHHNLENMGFTNLEVSSAQRFDFLKLLRGRVDLTPMGSKAIFYFLKDMEDMSVADFERVGPPIFFTTAYIAFAMKTPDDVIDKWQKALDELKKDGSWSRILDKYYPPDRPDAKPVK